jgi:hypothetical protein
MATNNKTDLVVGGGLQLGGYITKIAGTTPTNGQLLIGDATNGRFSIGSIATSNGVTVSQSAGTITLSSNATSANTASTLVSRDVSGNFTAGTITATSFIGSAAQLTGLTSSQVTTALGFTPSGGNSAITISGDATGSGSTSIVLTLANSGVVAGTYSAITVNSKGIVTTGGAIGSAVVTTALGYTPANTVSPAFTGTPTAPTATAGTNTTQLATTAFVNNAITVSSGGVQSLSKINGVNSPNLLLNGSGEFANVGWSTTNFASNVDSTTGTGTEFWNTAAIVSGATVFDESANIPCGPGVALCISAMVQTLGATAGVGYVNLVAYNSSGTGLGTVTATSGLASGSNLTFKTATGVTPANTAYVRVRKVADSNPLAPIGGFVFSRIKVEQGSTPSLYSQEANFAAGTPNQFDNSARLATTAFVTTAAGNFQSRQYLTGATVLTSALSGAWIELGSTGGYTVTLPDPTLRANTTFTFTNVTTDATTVTLSTPNAAIYNQMSASATFVVGQGATVELISDASNWTVISYYTKSPNFLGIPTAPTATAGTNTTQLATTAFVTSAITASNAGVASFNTRTGAITLTAADVTSAGGALLASPAFTGVPTSTTPAQFDNSSKIATTAFVANAGMQFNSAVELNSNQTLTGAQIGSAIQWYGAAGGVLTLPTASTMPTGRTFYIFNQGSGSLTIALTGASDFLWAGIVQYTTLTLIKGDSIFIMSRGSTEYDIIGGTAAHKYSARQLVNTIVDDGTSALQVNGIATVTTPTAGDNSTKVATTAFVTSAITAAASGVVSFNTRTGAVTLTAADVTGVGGALLASPALTGTPTAPTATTFDNSTTLATTAFVKASGLHFPNTAGIAITTAVTLNIAQLNGWCQFQSNVIATLPPIATTQNGTTYTFLGGTTGGTIKGNASESIELLNGTSSNTISVAIGEAITIAAQPGNSLWYVVMDGVGAVSLASYAPLASPTFTGRVYVPEGTASLPGVTFVNDGALDTGLWHISDGVFGITCNAVEQVRFATGVGTTFATPVFGPTAAVGSNTTQLATTAFVAAGKYYDVTGGAAGAITANQVLTLHVAARTLNFPASLAGSQGYVVTAPTASNTFTLAVNGATVGTMVFAAGSHTASFTTSSGAFTMTPGQYLTVIAPASADTTMATVSFTLLTLAT